MCFRSSIRAIHNAFPTVAYLFAFMLLAHCAPTFGGAQAASICASTSCRCSADSRSVYCHRAFDRASVRHFTGLAQVYTRFAGDQIEFSSTALHSTGYTLYCPSFASNLTTLVMPDCKTRVRLINCYGYNFRCHEKQQEEEVCLICMRGRVPFHFYNCFRPL